MLEVFCEGLDQNMWYVRVSASVDSLDVKLANAIVESLRIEIPEVGRYGIPSR